MLVAKDYLPRTLPHPTYHYIPIYYYIVMQVAQKEECWQGQVR